MLDLDKYQKIIIQKLTQQNESDKLHKLLEYHNQQIIFLQNERLIHLLVTLAFGIFGLVSILTTIIFKKNELLLLDFLFLILLIPYIFHYRKLENTVQKWYEIENEIYQKLGYLE
jgi:hypothetical protein